MAIFQNEYFIAILIVLFFIVFAKLSVYVLTKFMMRLAKKTKTDLDDKLLDVMTPQIYILLIFIGVYLALKALTILDSYNPIIDNGFFILGVLILAIAASKIMKVLVLHWLHIQKRFEKAPQLITKTISVIIYALALLIILDHFNISITPLLATLGVGAVAVGLALQGTLSNLFAGVRILSDKPVKLGDFVELDNQLSGYVEDISWSSTRIKTTSDTIVVVPNSRLADSIITNYSMPHNETSIVVQCGVSYKSNLEKVEKITLEVAKNIQKTVPGAVRDFKPLIRFHTFGDSNVNFSIILRAQNFVDKHLMTHALIKELKKRYDKEKISISFPVIKLVR